MENYNSCVSPKDLLKALNIINKFPIIDSITNIEFVSSDNRVASKIIKFESNISERNRETWKGEYFVDYDFLIILNRIQWFVNDIPHYSYSLLYGNSKSNNTVKCETKEETELLYKQIKKEELIDEIIKNKKSGPIVGNMHEYFIKSEIEELGLELENDVYKTK